MLVYQEVLAYLNEEARGAYRTMNEIGSSIGRERGKVRIALGLLRRNGWVQGHPSNHRGPSGGGGPENTYRITERGQLGAQRGELPLHRRRAPKERRHDGGPHATSLSRTLLKRLYHPDRAYVTLDQVLEGLPTSMHAKACSCLINFVHRELIFPHPHNQRGPRHRRTVPTRYRITIKGLLFLESRERASRAR